MGVLTEDLYHVVGSLSGRAAVGQGGVFSQENPSAYNASDPLPLWIIQVVVIMAMTQLLSLILSRIRQPRVIAEVIGGVLLGPTVMGRIPNFSATIFPTTSWPLLTLTANIGLVLFLFIIGMEVDVGLIKRNAKVSSAISIAGLVFPLGMGAALAVPLYHQFVDKDVNFGYFILFVAVAVGITAFPVLCRILTECKLLDTTVGLVVLSAGVGNDVVGWILLALTVALVNASSGLTALWVLLTSVGFVLFLLFPLKRAYRWLARRTGSLESGQPTTMMMTLTLLLVLGSAFFTDIIGVHPIFGGFLAGLVIPHDHGYAIAMVEKLEDLVSILLLPIYFALSGLKTNLGLLDNGVTWGYTILICVFAFVSKFVACGTAAKLTGFNFREAGAVGALMSCKGLVELIVLNVGLSAKILDTRVFSMFVVHAIVLTFITTPLTLWIYPARVRKFIDDTRGAGGLEGASGPRTSFDEDRKSKFTLVLDKMEHLPAAMTFTQLLQPSQTTLVASSTSDVEKTDGEVSDAPAVPRLPKPKPAVGIDALRLIELTGRTSAVLKSQEAETLLRTDPLVSVFRTFGHLNRLAVSAALTVTSVDDFAASIGHHVRDCGSQMVILPWSTDSSLVAGNDGSASGSAPVPVQAVFPSFVRKVYASAGTDVGLFIHRGIQPTAPGLGQAKQHIYLPFFGGPDDRLALSFVIQLCENGAATATVVRIKKLDAVPLTPADTMEEVKANIHGTITSQYNTVFPDTVYGNPDTQTRLQSDTADDLLWARYTTPGDTVPQDVREAWRHIEFKTESTANPLRTVLDAQDRPPMLAVVGRSRRLAVESHRVELTALFPLALEMAKTLGEVGAVLIAGAPGVSVLVVQTAANKRGTSTW